MSNSLTKTITYQKVISTQNPFSNITVHRRRALSAWRAHTVVLEKAKQRKENKHLISKGLQD